MITIYDIARETGYSPATVSKVLNNYDETSEKAKKIINEAIEKMNYIPNANARGLMTKKSYVIGLLLYEDDHNVFLHAHYSEILNSFKFYIESQGYDILFVNTKTASSKLTFYEHCKYRNIDGLLVLIGNTQNPEVKKQIEEIIESDLPKVSAESVYKKTTSVISDNYSGARKGMEYLYYLGHKEIAFISAINTTEDLALRYKAYKDYLEEKDINCNKNLIFNAKGYTKKDGEEVAKKLLKNGFDNLPTAIFCICDEVAIGVMEYLKKHSIRIPEDISILGFDDIKVAKYVGLSTINQNRKEIGHRAGIELLNAINVNGEGEAKKILIDTQLVIRNSCKSIK